MKSQILSNFINDYLFNQTSGYYRKSNPIGNNADFITAPEISSIFGELIALYIIQITSDKNKIAFVEAGAGKGSLFNDILSTIHKLAAKNIDLAQNFLQKTKFFIIEINEILKQEQQSKLKKFDITWCQTLQEFLQYKDNNSEILFLSNEFFDCFAIDQYVKTDIGWCQRLIDIDDNNIAFRLANFDPKIHNFRENNIGLEVSQKAPISSLFEFSESSCNFAIQLFKALDQYNGIVINIDYGYFAREFANSLQVISNHQKINFVDILTLDKKCDITAHVDFFLLDKIAKSYNLQSSLVTQREFLLSLGILNRMEQLMKLNIVNKENLQKSINRLINLDEMGELFKVHIVWSEKNEKY